MSELTLSLPVPLGSLDATEKRWTPSLLAFRKPESFLLNPTQYWSEFGPIFNVMEIDEKGSPSCTTVARQLFAWTSGCSECTKTEYACDAYSFEAIMAIAAMAASHWNESNQESTVEYERRRELLARACGMYDYLLNNQLTKWKTLPDPSQTPAECQRLFLDGMKRLCLAQRAYITVNHMLATNTDTPVEQFQTYYCHMLGAAETYRQAANMFRAAHKIHPRLAAYADGMFGRCYLAVIEWQVQIIEKKESGDAGKIVAFLNKRMQEHKNGPVYDALSSKKKLYDSSCTAMSLEIKDSAFIPVVAPKYPTQFVEFDATVQLDESMVSKAIKELLTAWKEGEGLKNPKDRVTLARLLRL